MMFHLIDRAGKIVSTGTKGDLIDLAHTLWPDQHQDDSTDFEEPNGWDIQPAVSASISKVEQ